MNTRRAGPSLLRHIFTVQQIISDPAAALQTNKCDKNARFEEIVSADIL